MDETIVADVRASIARGEFLLAEFAKLSRWQLFIRDPFGRKMRRLMAKYAYIPTIADTSPPSRSELWHG